MELKEVGVDVQAGAGADVQGDEGNVVLERVGDEVQASAEVQMGDGEVDVEEAGAEAYVVLDERVGDEVQEAPAGWRRCGGGKAVLVLEEVGAETYVVLDERVGDEVQDAPAGWRRCGGAAAPAGHVRLPWQGCLLNPWLILRSSMVCSVAMSEEGAFLPLACTGRYSTRAMKARACGASWPR